MDPNPWIPSVVLTEEHHHTEEQLRELLAKVPRSETWINTRTGETFEVEAKPGPSRTWRFGSLD